MSRSVRSSFASVHSLRDSLGEEEFLTASPFNPKNVELRRAKRNKEQKKKTAFQPEFCRIDSMMYRGGHGIVEDSFCMAPIDVSPSQAPALQAPHKPSVMNGHAAAADSGTRPPTHHNTASQSNRIPSASRRRGSSRGGGRSDDSHSIKHTAHNGAGRLNNSMSIPAPPVPSPQKSSDRYGGSSSIKEQREAPAPPHPTHAAPAVTPHHSVTTTSTTASPRKEATPAAAVAAAEVDTPFKQRRSTTLDALIMAPLSPANSNTMSFNSPSVAAASRPVKAPHPPRQRAFSATTTTTATTAKNTAPPTEKLREDVMTHIQRRGERLPLGRLGRAQMERRKTVPAPDFAAPLSPPKTLPVESPTYSFTSATGGASSSSQTSIPPLPPLDGTTTTTTSNSSNTSKAVSPMPTMAQRRTTASPARLRLTGGRAPSPPASGRSLAAAMAGALDSDSRCPAQSSPTERRFTARATPEAKATAERSTTTSSPLKITSTNSVLSVAPSVSSPTSSSISETPVATPSATLRLMAEQMHSRSPVTATPTLRTPAVAAPAAATGGFAFHRPPPPPRLTPQPQPKPQCVVPVPRSMTRPAPPAAPPLPTQNRITPIVIRRPSSDPPSPVSADTGVTPAPLAQSNDQFLKQVKQAQRQQQSLLDPRGKHFSDSVRRLYCYMPSEEDATIPTFARRAGDLHVANGRANTSAARRRTMEDSTSMVLLPTAPPSPPPDVSQGQSADSTTSPVTTPAVTPPSPQRDSEGRGASEEYFIDTTSVTRPGLRGTQWSGQSKRYIFPQGPEAMSDTQDSSSSSSEDEMEPLMLDAVMAFNKRFNTANAL